MTVYDKAHHLELFFQRGIGINVVESVLMQIILSYRLCRLHRYSILRRKRVDTDKPYYFVEIGFLLKYPLGFPSQFSPLFSDVLVVPYLQPVRIERIALQPIYRGEVSSVCQRRRKSPEYLYNSESSLRYRLRKVSSRRRNRRYSGDRTYSFLSSESLNYSRSFVIIGKSRGQIRGITLFARHLFKTSRHLS